MLARAVGLIYASIAAIVVASAIIGQGVRALCGQRSWSWLAPAVGFAVLLIVDPVLVRFHGGATTAAAVTLALVVAALLLPSVRAALVSALPEGLPLAVVVGFAASLPFLVSDRTGVLGAGDDNDMVAHLTAVYWLLHHVGPQPGLIHNGYPLGPHGVVAALAGGLHVPIVAAFNGLTLAVPVIASLAALSILRGPRLPWRWVAAGLVGLCYLAASYLVQGSFKETIQGLLLLAFALALRELLRAERRPPWRAGIPAGLLAAAPIYTYSYLGAAWPVAAAVAVVALELAFTRRGLSGRLARARRGLPVALAATGAFVVGVLPDVHRLILFNGSTFNHEALQGKANLIHSIDPIQLAGIWLRSDFRFNPQHVYALTLLLAAVACAVFFAGLVWLGRRRDFALPAAAATGLLIYWQATMHKNIYNQAKGLAVVAPVIAATILVVLMEAWRPLRERLADRPTGPLALNTLPRLTVARALSGVLILAAGASSFLALRDGPVNAPSHGNQLASFLPIVHGQRVLILDNDDFAHWYLRGTDLGTGPLLYMTRLVPPRAAKGWAPAHPFDFDTFSPHSLDQNDYVIGPAGGYQSVPPPNFHPIRRTADFVLWKRVGPTPWRRPLERKGGSGAVLDCSTPQGKAVLAQGGVAAVLPPPIIRSWSQWQGQPRFAGQSGTQTFQVPAGTWDLSLQYVSYTGMDLTAPGLRLTLPANLARTASYWPAGTIHLDRPETITVRITARRMGTLARLLGANGYTRALNSPRAYPLDRLALTRHGAPERLIPMSQACGRYVDWYRPAKLPASAHA